MPKRSNKKTSNKPNNPQPNRWSFLKSSQDALERQKTEPAQEEGVQRIDQSDNLNELDPDIKESLGSKQPKF